MRFEGEIKGFKFWNLKDKKLMYSKNITFDEASMLKSSSSHHMKNKTNETLQRLEFDVTLYIPVSST